MNPTLIYKFSHPTYNYSTMAILKMQLEQEDN